MEDQAEEGKRASRPADAAPEMTPACGEVKPAEAQQERTGSTGKIFRVGFRKSGP